MVLVTAWAILFIFHTTNQLNNFFNLTKGSATTIAFEKKALTTSGGEVKIVAFTSHDYSVVSKWWYKRMSDLGYNTHTLILIDEAAVNDFNAINATGEEFYRFEVMLVDPGKRRKNFVRSLWYSRILYCLNQLKAGQSLLLTDTDNVFSKYESLDQFYNSDYDAIFALEMKFPTYIFDKQEFVLCGGMTFLKSTNATIQMWERLLEVCDGGTKRCDDQVELNKLLADDMIWDSQAALLNKTKDGLVQNGFVGKSKTVQDFSAKVWDRDFAWRGPLDTDICPSNSNWVSMPMPPPQYAVRMLEKGNLGEQKLARVSVWENFCGKNGINRNIKMGNSTEDRLVKAVKKYLEKE